jgi:hypothetical protein
MPRPGPLAVVIETDVPINATAEKRTDMVISLMRGVIKMIAHTIATPHDKTEGTETAIKTINLITMMTEGTRRLRNPLRTAKVAIMLTTWKQVSPLLVTFPIPAVRNHPSGKSRKFVSDHPHTIDPKAALQVNWRRTTAFSQGTPP